MVLGRKLAKFSILFNETAIFLGGKIMDKIQLLQERKAKIAEAGKEIRARINALADAESFVELSAFSF